MSGSSLPSLGGQLAGSMSALALIACVAVSLGGCDAARRSEATAPRPRAAPHAVVDSAAYTQAGAILAALESAHPQTFREADLTGRVNVSAAPDDAGRPCRTYNVQLVGKPQSGTAAVCRAADGNWQIVED